MASFDLDMAEFEKAVEFGMNAGVLFLQGKIVEITPRDPLRPPKNPNAKVKGNLKRSIGNEKRWEERLIGVRSGYFDTEIYGRAQEFGTFRIPPRSFLRKGLFDNYDKSLKIMEEYMNKYLTGK